MSYPGLTSKACDNQPKGAAVRDSMVIFALTAGLRIPFTSKPYFADGPAHLLAIKQGVYLIEPPGYWLFNHSAALFPNPAMGISVLNILFASLGAVIFYAVARWFMPLFRARAATALYATVFYAWFSAEVHSTYASQLLFPVLTFYCLLRSLEGRRRSWLYAAAIAFAIGAGMRPSDGLFLLPMMIYFLFRYAWNWRAIGPTLLATILCLAWFIPTCIGLAKLQGVHNSLHYMANIVSVVSIARGLNSGSEANIIRLLLPLLVAFGIVLMGLRRKWDEVDRLLALWIIPGFLFFLLSYVSDAPYLDYFTAAIVLLCARGTSVRRLSAAALLNAVIFLFLPPICTIGMARPAVLPVKVINHYVLQYTLPESRRHRLHRLSEDQGSCY